jgi:hypothetical protein
LVTSLSALAAAGMMAVAVQTGVVPPPPAVPPTVISAVQQAASATVAVPVLGGTAVASTAAAVATSASAKRERQQQRVRLEQLKKEVAALQVCAASTCNHAASPCLQPSCVLAILRPSWVWCWRYAALLCLLQLPCLSWSWLWSQMMFVCALRSIMPTTHQLPPLCCAGHPSPVFPFVQDLQQQELALLQLQMSAKATEFVSAWQVVQDDLTRESEERVAVEDQLAAVQQEVRIAADIAAPAAAAAGVAAAAARLSLPLRFTSGCGVLFVWPHWCCCCSRAASICLSSHQPSSLLFALPVIGCCVCRLPPCGHK